MLGQHRMAQCVRPDGDAGRAGEGAQRLGGQAFAFDQRSRIDARLRRQLGNRREQNRFRAFAQTPVEPVERRLLLSVGSGRSVETAVRQFDRNARQRPDRLLQLQPPEPGGALGKAAHDIERPGRLMLGQHRPGMIEIVAIAVIEGERDEEAARFGIGQPGQRLVERDDVVALGPDQGQRPIEKIGRDLQQPVRMETAGGCRADMVQRQDRALALREPPAPAVGAGRRDGREGGRKSLVAQAHARRLREIDSTLR